MYSFIKPSNWLSLPLFKKIQVYKDQLDERYTKYVDKLSAKEVVKSICGDELHLAKVIKVLNSPDDIQESDLNPNHIIKSTHGSGWNINITNETKLDLVKENIHYWNKTYIGSNETHYQHIQPRFFIEEKIDDFYTGKSGQALVFMFRCIQGYAYTIGVKNGSIQNMYTIDGTVLQENFPFTLPMDSILKMTNLADMLSEPFEFVRIDFYLDKDENIYFSEYTFTPAGGQQIYSNQIEDILGSYWL